ncbi:SHOCT domain-containing protein [Sphingomonas sp. ZT3P38]|uniref:SHOCT domain-containing protein n=1 Tax=Parasphingomonas zepuensis TaxID=3096161 RepID=UPI002FC92A80
MTDTKGSGASNRGDTIKLIIAALGLLLICLSGVGLIPVAILAIGLAISIKVGGSRAVRVTTRIVQLAGILLAIGLAIGAADQHFKAVAMAESLGPPPSANPAYKDVLEYTPVDSITDYAGERTSLYYRYLDEVRSYGDRVRELNQLELGRAMYIAGVLLSLLGTALLPWLWYRPVERQLHVFRALFAYRPRPRVKSPNIMAREALAGYSAADELAKWSRLRDEGVVTDQEYQNARAKILGTG